MEKPSEAEIWKLHNKYLVDKNKVLMDKIRELEKEIQELKKSM